MSVLSALLVADAYCVRNSSELVESIRYQSSWPLRGAWVRWTKYIAPRTAISLTEGQLRYLNMEGLPPEYMQDFTIVIGKDGSIRDIVAVQRWDNPQLSESESKVHVQLWAHGMLGPRRGFGFWAPTHIQTWCSAYVSTNDYLTDAQYDALVESLAHLASAAPFPKRETAAWSRSIIEDKANQVVYLYSGYLHNTLTLSLLGALLYTLASTPFALRRALRTSKNACTRCGYNVSGLSAPICPECASPLP